MRLTRLRVRNYRSLEDISLTIPGYYAAICGRNDSGKTNVLRVIRSLLVTTDYDGYQAPDESSLNDDFTKWRADEAKEMSLEMDLIVNHEADEGLHKFLSTYLTLEESQTDLQLEIGARYTAEADEPRRSLVVNGKAQDDLKAEEVFAKLQSSRAILFHNSTELTRRFAYPGAFGGFLGEFASGESVQIEAVKQRLNKELDKLATRHQKNITELLGRLNEKYRVGLTIAKFNLDFLPFTITLGEKGVAVPLEDWGSGTKNRTRILMTLFRAKQISEAATSASKTTPTIVIEEPESFLHPSAQAEFGRLLQDLAEEWKVQVIVTTHSPYMLSQGRPESNVLLDRRTQGKHLRETYRVDTAGENWMEPFGLALGIDNAEFQPWRDVLFGKEDAMLMVEGDIDKEFFDMLRDEVHGDNRLIFTGEIFAYGGKDTLKNAILLKFIRNRFKRLFITYDLDAEQSVSRCLSSLNLRRNIDYCPVGIDAPGKRAIEGLLPESICKQVYQSNPDLVGRALHGTSDEQRSAKNSLKRLMLDEFKAVAKPGKEYFGGFYPLAKTISHALKA